MKVLIKTIRDEFEMDGLKISPEKFIRKISYRTFLKFGDKERKKIVFINTSQIQTIQFIKDENT